MEQKKDGCPDSMYAYKNKSSQEGKARGILRFSERKKKHSDLLSYSESPGK
jgi:hypothetical protein